jgi:hypothetical protein
LQVLVADTSVIIDLERGNLVEPLFELDYEFAVPDVLFEFELRPHGGERLLELGLRVVDLDETAVASALQLRDRRRSLSVADAFAFSLAQANSWVLLTGDGELRILAHESGLRCHGVLWFLDELYGDKVVPATQLHSSLFKIAAHPRCRLPAREIENRLRSYANARRGK